MKPGKRPGSPSFNKYNHNKNHGGDASTRAWDMRFSTHLQRCIHTHDATHILQWHTPTYTLAVYASLMAVFVALSSFPSVATYAALAVALTLVCGAAARFLEVESGPSAVLVPTESRVRSKATVEANLRSLYARLVEPALAAVGAMTARDVGAVFVVVTVAAELGKWFSGGAVAAVLVTALFAFTGVQALKKKKKKGGSTI